MDKIRDAILSRVQVEAEELTDEAKQKGQEEIEKARKQQESKLEEEKRKVLGEAEEEAARIVAQASIKARQQLSSAKADIIARIVEDTRKELSRTPGSESDLLELIREAVEGLGAEKARIYVSPRDMGAAKEALEADKELSGRTVEIRESDCLGGVIAEDVEGKIRIDNTYETRLEMLLPRLLPEISNDLFASP
ncbi:MAG: V-type ATP synthase subunit E [Dehalococcoidia bacterium]